MGINMDGFDDPICKSFKAKVHNDQLCYEVDLEKFRNKENLVRQLKYGLIMILDYNEENQFIVDKEKNNKKYENKFVGEEENSVNIYLNTIGRNL